MLPNFRTNAVRASIPRMGIRVRVSAVARPSSAAPVPPPPPPGDGQPATGPAGERLSRLFGEPGRTDAAPGGVSQRPSGQTPIGGDGDRAVKPTHGHDQRLTLLLSWADWRPTSWVDALPVLLEPLGIHSVRAGSAREAERLVRSTPIHLAVVDLGLPFDHAASTEPSAGPRVLELLRRLESPPPTVVVKDRHFTRNETRHMHAALNAQAFAVVDRSSADLELMLKVLHRAMDRFYRGRWPGCGGPA